MRFFLLAAVMIGCSSPSEQAVEPPVDSAVAVIETSTDAADAVTDTLLDTFEPETIVDTPASCGCASYTDPVVAGSIGGTAVTELSGLAVSRAHPGVVWAHNDSGDTPRIFALGDKGAFLGEVRVTDATAVDWEDLALGPCDGGSCLFIGDIGNNSMSRTDLAVYRLAEPSVENKPFAMLTTTAVKLPFAYPDGRHNAEALLVHPVTGEMVIVTKGSSSGVYRFPTPLTPGVSATLVKVGVVTGLDGIVTGGDASPCGDRALVRTYGGLFEFTGATLGDALTGAAKRVPVATEPQGEAVSYREGGRGYFTASEGRGVPLSATSCK